jgi:hypothetical protein
LVLELNRHKFFTNSNAKKSINNPENAKEILPKKNPGSTVISITLTSIETRTKRDVRFKIMEIPPLFDRSIITISILFGINYFGKITKTAAKKIATPIDKVR